MGFSWDFHWIFSDLECLSNIKWQHSVSDPDSQAPRSNHAAGTCVDVRDRLRNKNAFRSFANYPWLSGMSSGSITGFCLPKCAGIQ